MIRLCSDGSHQGGNYVHSMEKSRIPKVKLHKLAKFHKVAKFHKDPRAPVVFPLVSGGVEEGGHPGAALIEAALLTSQSDSLSRPPSAAVVRYEEDNTIVEHSLIL